MALRAPDFDRKPHSWHGRAKHRVNRLLSPLPKRFRVKLSPVDRHGPGPRYQQWLERIWADYVLQTNLTPALVIFVICVAMMLLTLGPLGIEQPLQNLWVEFGGLTFDVFFILVIFSLFEHRRQIRQEIARQKETIEDYKSWDSAEARFRIAGALRRLNKRGIHAIDFSGVRLSDFVFSTCGINSIKGSNFYDGVWGEPHADSSVTLQRVDFSHLDCRDVVFSPYDAFGGLFEGFRRYARLSDCSFIEADLKGASFNGASLKWTETPPDDLYEYHHDESGQYQGSGQVAYGPFDNADLTGASFVSTIFENVDFRNAEGLESADFTGAKGLENAFFDSDEIKDAVLKMARSKPKEI